jgi:hypothetical protein
MQANSNGGGLGKWIGRAWLLPLMFSLFACGGGGGDSSDATPGTGQPPTQQPPAQGTSIPENLRGQWETILTYVPAFYSGPYGDIPQGDGSIGITLYIYPDGSYHHYWNLAQTYFGGNCFRSAGWDEVGTMSGDGSSYTFNPTKATYTAVDSCGQSKFLDPAPVSPATHTLTLSQDNTGWPVLTVSFPSGDLVLERCRKCQ